MLFLLLIFFFNLFRCSAHIFLYLFIFILVVLHLLVFSRFIYYYYSFFSFSRAILWRFFVIVFGWLHYLLLLYIFSNSFFTVFYVLILTLLITVAWTKTAQNPINDEEKFSSFKWKRKSTQKNLLGFFLSSLSIAFETNELNRMHKYFFWVVQFVLYVFF